MDITRRRPIAAQTKENKRRPLTNSDDYLRNTKRKIRAAYYKGKSKVQSLADKMKSGMKSGMKSVGRELKNVRWRPDTAGPEPAGPEPAGPEDAGPATAGPATAGPDTTLVRVGEESMHSQNFPGGERDKIFVTEDPFPREKSSSLTPFSTGTYLTDWPGDDPLSSFGSKKEDKYISQDEIPLYIKKQKALEEENARRAAQHKLQQSTGPAQVRPDQNVYVHHDVAVPEEQSSVQEVVQQSFDGPELLTSVQADVPGEINKPVEGSVVEFTPVHEQPSEYKVSRLKSGYRDITEITTSLNSKIDNMYMVPSGDFARYALAEFFSIIDTIESVELTNQQIISPSCEDSMSSELVNVFTKLCSCSRKLKVYYFLICACMLIRKGVCLAKTIYVDGRETNCCILGTEKIMDHPSKGTEHLCVWRKIMELCKGDTIIKSNGGLNNWLSSICKEHKHKGGAENDDYKSSITAKIFLNMDISDVLAELRTKNQELINSFTAEIMLSYSSVNYPYTCTCISGYSGVDHSTISYAWKYRNMKALIYLVRNCDLLPSYGMMNDMLLDAVKIRRFMFPIHTNDTVDVVLEIIKCGYKMEKYQLGYFKRWSNIRAVTEEVQVPFWQRLCSKCAKESSTGCPGYAAIPFCSPKPTMELAKLARNLRINVEGITKQSLCKKLNKVKLEDVETILDTTKKRKEIDIENAFPLYLSGETPGKTCTRVLGSRTDPPETYFVHFSTDNVTECFDLEATKEIFSTGVDPYTNEILNDITMREIKSHIEKNSVSIAKTISEMYNPDNISLDTYGEDLKTLKAIYGDHKEEHTLIKLCMNDLRERGIIFRLDYPSFTTEDMVVTTGKTVQEYSYELKYLKGLTSYAN